MENEEEAGFLRLSRKIFKNELWKNDREYSKFEAWLDILQSASYEHKEKTVWIQDKPIKIGRGQFPASIRFLQDRWHWRSKTKVINFLKWLENEYMITLETGTGQTVITICKYAIYNDKKNKVVQQEDSEWYSEGTAEGQRKDKVKKGKKVKKEKIYTEVVSEQLLNLTSEQLERWSKYDAWFKKSDFENLVKIKNQMTPAQLFKLLDGNNPSGYSFTAPEIKDVLTQLENYSKANNYQSVYLTCLNWLKKRREPNN